MKMNLLLVFSLWSSFAISQDIAAIKLPHRLTSDKSTPYRVILENFQNSSKTQSQVFVAPVIRSVRQFFTKKQKCLIPTSVNAMHFFHPKEMKKFKVIESAPIENVVVKVFSKPGSAPLKRISDLNGKRIATWNGIYSDKLLPNIEVKVLKINDDIQSLALLKRNRVDYVIGFLPDTPMVAQISGYKELSYSKNLSLLTTPVHLICHESPESIQFIKKFNSYLKKIKKSGELQRILGKYSVIVK